MSAIAGRGPRPVEEPGDDFSTRPYLDRLVAWRPRITWDVAAVGVFLVAGMLLRFHDLGHNAIHHDESLHAVWSWRYFTGQGYTHDPLMHGPFLFHAMAFIYALFGVSDATARVVPALFGTALIAMPLLLRTRLGRAGTVAAAFLLAFSPSLFYFSRFVGAGGQDMVLVAMALLMAAAIWRYIDEGRARWLYLTAGALSISFATKEVTFFTALIFIIWLNGLLAYEFAAQRSESQTARLGWTVAFFPVAWLVATLWGILPEVRRLLRLESLPRSGDLLLILGLLTAPQFAAAVQVPLERFGYEMTAPSNFSDWTNEELFGKATVVGLIAVTTIAGLAWRRRQFAIAALVFWSIYIVLYTSLFTHQRGFASGIWGSLDYWIAQHGEERGAQPVFYYSMLTPIYEYLALLLGLGGVAAAALRIGRWRSAVMLVGAACLAVGVLSLLGAVVFGDGAHKSMPWALLAILALVAALRRDLFRSFIAFWAAATLFGLSVSGEKMPWLETHIALPLAVLGAIAVNDAFAAWPLIRANSVLQRVLAVATGVALLIAAILIFPDNTSTWTVALIIMALVVVGALAFSAVTGGRKGLGLALTAVALALLGPLTVRDAYRAAFINADTPNDLLIYTQTSPELKAMAARVDELARVSGKGKNLAVTVDVIDAFTWPWAWYLRDYTNVSWVDLAQWHANPPRGATPPDVILAGYANQSAIAATDFANVYGPGERYPHRWWFPEEGYRQTSGSQFWEWVRDPDMWKTWTNFFLHRDLGRYPIGSIDGVAFFPADFTPSTPLTGEVASNFEPRMIDGRLVAGGSGSALGAFSRPAGLATDAQGNLYIADSLNHRLQKLAPDGTHLATTPRDARLREPWGVAVNAQGEVYVADTWNHRIQKFDSEMRPVLTWGAAPATIDPINAGPLELWGPRDIAIDAQGNLFVTDTGHSRVLKFSPDGQPLGKFGSPGSGRGQFQEPTSIAVGPNGEIFVADAWNARVQRFDPTFNYLGEIAVLGWTSHDAEMKPYVRVAADGSVFVSIPEQGRVEQYSVQGQRLNAWTAFGDGPAGRPLGVALDSSGMLWVADAAASEVVRIAR